MSKWVQCMCAIGAAHTWEMIRMSNPTDSRVLEALLKEQSAWASVCTEPAMVALAAAKAAHTLGEPPVSIDVYLSAGVLKNALSAGLPHTAKKGPEIAAALGALSAQPELGLTILGNVTETQLDEALELAASSKVTVHWAREHEGVYGKCVLKGANHVAEAVIEHSHTNITRVALDGRLAEACATEARRSDLQVLREWDFPRLLAAALDLSVSRLGWLLEGARSCVRLSEKASGLMSEDVIDFAWVCSSDSCETPIVEVANRVSRAISARMSGVPWPVVTSGGSGNQGIMVSVPVMSVAKHLGLDEELTIRALTIAHSVNLFVKAYMGEVSCSCGGVGAAAGIAAATCWMRGGTVGQMEEAISQVLASLFGTICDGAKATCALKGTTSVLTGMLTGLGASRSTGSIRDQGVLGSTLNETLTRIAALNEGVINKADELMLDLMRPEASTPTQ
jgi:L-cysteine desulfidase